MDNGQLEQHMTDVAERLAAAAVQLENAIAGMEERHADARGDVARIVATVEGNLGGQQAASLQELESKLVVAEQKIASLQAQLGANATVPVRRTKTPEAVQMFSKTGAENLSGLEAGALDAALTGLSLEQRIAVKAQLARAGMFGL